MISRIVETGRSSLYILVLAALFWSNFSCLAQEKCPSFVIQNTKSGMHYGLRKPSPPGKKSIPREGVLVFLGGYASTDRPGIAMKGDVHMVEFGWSLGWETTHYIERELLEDQAIWTIRPDIFVATFSKYFLLGDRGLVSVGPGYGFVQNEASGQRQYFLAQSTISLRFWRDVWLSGKIQMKDFQQLPTFKVGLSTLLW